MKTGIVGLGLIGGSMAKAYKKSGQTVFGADINEITLGYALLSGIADEKLTDENIGECDLILLAVNPDTACPCGPEGWRHDLEPGAPLP